MRERENTRVKRGKTDGKSKEIKKEANKQAKNDDDVSEDFASLFQDGDDDMVSNTIASSN